MQPRPACGSREKTPGAAGARKHLGWQLSVIVFVCVVATRAHAAVTVELSTATARPGETTEISAVLTRNAGEEVAAVQIDLTFDADVLSIAADADGRPDCDVEPAIGKPASGFGFGPSRCGTDRRPCSRMRAVIVATDNVDPIADGAVLYRCRVDVAFDAPMGRQLLRGRRALYSDPSGRERTAVSTDAAITVAGTPLDTPTPAPTATPRNTPTRSGSGSGSGGGCQLETRAGSGRGVFLPALLAGLFWLVRNSSSLSRVWRRSRKRSWRRAARESNYLTESVRSPLKGTRATVVQSSSDDFLQRLSRGIRFHRARSGIDDAFLVNPRHTVSLLAVLALLFIASQASAAVSVDIGSVSGVPGESVVVDVRLTADAGEEVAGTQNDLRFDPAIAPVAALEDGTPDCTVNMNINKLATAFGFRPSQCDPVLGECSAVRAIVLAFDNVDPIPDTSVLYSCRFVITTNAAPGEYELANTRTGYAPPPGGDRPAAGRAGLLTVLAAPTPTPRPTEHPEPTATMPTAVPTTPVAHDPGDANCDGMLDREDLRAVVASIFTRAESCNADCNRDGQISGPDLVCVTYRRVLASGTGSPAADRYRRLGRSSARGRIGTR